MATPQWTTPAGILGEIEERVSYSKTLSATDADGGTLTFSVHAGSLPTGLSLSTSGIISGITNEVAERTEKTFVVRVSNNEKIADRTFTLFVEGADFPTWTTIAGTLDVVYDGSYINIQLEATDSDTGDSTALTYSIVSGGLPGGTTLDTVSGRISGVVDPVALNTWDSTNVGFDATAFDETQPFDLIVRIGSIDQLYQFTVRVSDGIAHADRTFNLDVRGLGATKADDTNTTADATQITADFSDVRSIHFTQSGIIATLSSDDYNIIPISIIDPDAGLGLDGATTVRYNIINGAFPPGMQINKTTGIIAGLVPPAIDDFTDYNFTIEVTKTSAIFGVDKATQEMTIRITGSEYNNITWNTPVKELVL